MTGMTPERLDAIRANLPTPDADLSRRERDALDLLAEIDRLRRLHQGQSDHIVALRSEVERLRALVDVADRVAASLGLVLHDAHPTYGSTALWGGGIGGQAITSHCSIAHGAHPGGEWAEYDLPSHWLREWVAVRGADYDHDAMKVAVRDGLLALLNPTEGETDE